MKMKWLLGLAALPFLAGVASAAQPLSDMQMDKVTAGFDSASLADAEALGQVVASTTATLSQVAYTGYSRECRRDKPQPVQVARGVSIAVDRHEHHLAPSVADLVPLSGSCAPRRNRSLAESQPGDLGTFP